jgi:hypothetical protein
MDVASAGTPLSPADGKAQHPRGIRTTKHNIAHSNDITPDDAIYADWVSIR